MDFKIKSSPSLQRSESQRLNPSLAIQKMPELPKTPEEREKAFKANMRSMSMPELPALPDAKKINASIDIVPPESMLQEKNAVPVSPKGLVVALEKLAPVEPDVRPQTTAEPPPKLDNQQLQTILNDGLKDVQSIQDFTGTHAKINNLMNETHHLGLRLDVNQAMLKKIEDKIHEKEKKYNSPLYQVAHRLGFVNRHEKLQLLEAQLKNPAQDMRALVASQKSQIDLLKIKLKSLEQQQIHQATQGTDVGRNFITQNIDNKALVWSLSTKSKTQLQEDCALAVLNNHPQAGELMATYTQQLARYEHRLELYNNLKEKVAFMNTVSRNFNNKATELMKTDPDAANELIIRMTKEADNYRANVINPLALAYDPNAIDPSGKLTINVKKPFPDAPPTMYKFLPPEGQTMVENMVKGLQASLPSRILDNTSVMINGKTYTDKQKIAEAGFAEIFAYKGEDGSKIVVKVPLKKHLSEEEFQAKILSESGRELDNHYHAMGVNGEGHPNMVKLVGAIATEHGPLIAMEYVDSGNTHNFVNHILPEMLANGTISQTSQNSVNKLVLLQMMQGMEHMHARGMSHMDVKPDNFFLTSDGTVKVADFGMSKTVDEFQAKRSDRGDLPLYLAPELVADYNLYEKYTHGKAITNKADVWSVGIIAHEMFLNSNPFDDKFMYRVEEKLGAFAKDVNNLVRKPMDDQPLTAMDDFLNKMLHPDPNQRMTFAQARKHPFMQDIFQDGQVKPEIQQLLKAMSQNPQDQETIARLNQTVGG